MQLKPELKALVSTMAAHLAKQRGQSKRPNGICGYRGDGGGQCAVGCLIPDEIYDKEIEGGVHWIFSLKGGANEAVSKHLMTLAPPGMLEDGFVSFLSTTQQYHDSISEYHGAGNYIMDLDAGVDASDEDLQATIETSLTTWLLRAPREEWIVCPT